LQGKEQKKKRHRKFPGREGEKKRCFPKEKISEKLPMRGKGGAAVNSANIHKKRTMRARCGQKGGLKRQG